MQFSEEEEKKTLILVEKALALGCAAKTGNAVLGSHFSVELVVVCQLLICDKNWLACIVSSNPKGKLLL